MLLKSEFKYIFKVLIMFRKIPYNILPIVHPHILVWVYKYKRVLLYHSAMCVIRYILLLVCSYRRIRDISRSLTFTIDLFISRSSSTRTKFLQYNAKSFFLFKLITATVHVSIMSSIINPWEKNVKCLYFPAK